MWLEDQNLMILIFKVKVSHDWSLPEKEIQQSVTKKPDISLEKKKKKKENLIFNDIEESDYEMETFKNEKVGNY